MTYDGITHEVDDPYRFLPTLGEVDLHLINEGRHEQLWEVLGARVHHYETPLGDTVTGTSFAVWAPKARGVRVKGDFNTWDGREHPMRQLGESGVWELFVPGIGSGTTYKYWILGADGHWQREGRPAGVPRRGGAGDRRRASSSRRTSGATTPGWPPAPQKQPVDEAMSVYEMHLGSWKRHPGGGFWSYDELADDLVPYLADLGFTHVELMPVMQHPFGGSWGYHVTSYFAPDSRFGDPDGFRRLVDRLHQAGIGVILDWVPGHFATDPWALAQLRRRPALRGPQPAARLARGVGLPHLRLRPPRGAQLPLRQRASTGSRSSTPTGCGSTASPRCSTSTTRATRASGRRTSTAAARTSRRSSSCRR